MLLVCAQWEAKVTQYERDFDRIGMTVRKEVLRFEVSVCFMNLVLLCANVWKRQNSNGIILNLQETAK